MRPSDFIAPVLLFSSTASAWPSGWDALQNEIAPLLKRQDDQTTRSSFNLDFTGVQGDTASLTSTSGPDSTQTGDGDSETTGTSRGDATGSESRTGTARVTGTNTDKTGTGTTRAASSSTFDARLPAGGVSMITPNAMTSSYVKIKDPVTFVWNYTSLLATPSYVDVLASCSVNQQTYTIALNQSVEETQTVVWDTGNYQATGTVALLTETYTLIIHDSSKDVTDLPQAGYLGTYNQFTFGMYTPQPYTPMADYICATCNSALTSIERQTLWAIFAMAGVTVLSFGWFTGVAGLW